MSASRQDTGLQCLIMMARFHEISVDPAALEYLFGKEKFTVETILLAAKKFKMKAKYIQQDPSRLNRAPLPAIGIDRSGHFMIVGKVDTQEPVWKILIQKPGQTPQILALNDFLSDWSGQLIFFTSQASLLGEMAKFDFTWFIPSVIKYRKSLGEVLLISFVLQLIGLITPMFFQVVMDKVLVNYAMKTLNVVVIGLILATMFEAILTGIRTAVFSNTSSKIDVELGSRLFQHVLNLPISYFQVRRAGESVARIRELENIRSFLTSNAITVLLDFMFSFVFIAVMFWYSFKLTLIVLASIPIYFLLSLFFTPLLREKLHDKFNKNAENQAFLIETLTGIQTLKSMAIAPRWQKKWDQQLASYVSAGLSTTHMSLVANGSVNLVSKLVTASIMWMGALLVLNQSLTVGELVAFNMLAGQISSPILRMAQLWNDFQQVGISMSRLGDILNAKTEIQSQKTRMPKIKGSISVEQVSFRYHPDSPLVMNDVSFHLQPGEVVGIVGRSGSGKSTLTKLIQRLYFPEKGRILIDGHDIAMADVASLRQQIGVVLQDNTLFSRSIRENIALMDPSIPLETVIASAKLAGAHDFICDLPDAYDTLVGEQGTGLSGGQRQRIAIARALIHHPRILIFDEATSALDYESEKIIQDNMRLICSGRTVLIIAHRLSAVREAHKIMVMDKGKLAEMGSHEELISHPNGIYRYLYYLQNDVDPS